MQASVQTIEFSNCIYNQSLLGASLLPFQVTIHNSVLHNNFHVESSAEAASGEPRMYDTLTVQRSYML